MTRRGVSSSVVFVYLLALWHTDQRQAHAFTLTPRTPAARAPGSPTVTNVRGSSGGGTITTTTTVQTGGGRIFQCRFEDPTMCRHGREKGPSSSARIATLLEASSSGKGPGRGGQEGEEDKYIIPGSGMRGVDTSQLSGSERRDAEWFERTAGRESRGELQWFENPVAYVAVFVGVTGLVFVYAVLACFIPGYCLPN